MHSREDGERHEEDDEDVVELRGRLPEDEAVGRGRGRARPARQRRVVAQRALLQAVVVAVEPLQYNATARTLHYGMRLEAAP